MPESGQQWVYCGELLERKACLLPMEEPTVVELPLDRKSGSVSRKLPRTVVVAMPNFSSVEFS